MTTTPHLTLPYLLSSQAQKDVTHNDALNDIDALAQPSALDRDLATPPASPAAGDTYIIATAPTGAWSGQAGKIAAYYSGWRIKTPREGWLVWVRDEDRLLYHDGSNWGNLGTPFLQATASWDPANLADGAGATSAAITVTGAAFGDFVLVAAPYDLQGITCTAYVNAANSVVIRLQNESGAAVDLGNGSWRVRVVKP